MEIALAGLAVLAVQPWFDVIDASTSFIVYNYIMGLCKDLIFNVCEYHGLSVSLHGSIILSCAPCRRSQVGSGTTVRNQSRETWLWHDNMMNICGSV